MGYQDGPRENVKRFMVAEDIHLSGVFGAATNVVYSFTGHWLYFELMAEMEKPEEFTKALWVNTPLQIFLYLLVAFWAYYFGGDASEGYFLENIVNNLSYRIASAILFAHVSIAFLIKNIVLSRYMHGRISPSRVNVSFRQPGGHRAHLEYAMCSMTLMVTGALLANVVPFVMQFMGLVGGLLSGPVSFFLPMAFYIGAQRSALARRVDQSGVSLTDWDTSPQSPAGRTLTSTWRCSDWTDVLVMASIALFILATMIMGTYDNVDEIITKMNTTGKMFTCRASTRYYAHNWSGNDNSTMFMTDVDYI